MQNKTKTKNRQQFFQMKVTLIVVGTQSISLFCLTKRFWDYSEKKIGGKSESRIDQKKKGIKTELRLSLNIHTKNQKFISDYYVLTCLPRRQVNQP